MIKHALYLNIVILALAGCTSTATVAPTATPTPPPAATPAPTQQPAATEAPSATAVPPASSAAPTATPTLPPAATPAPTATPTAAPTDTAAPTNTPEPTLPAAPAGLTVERLSPNQFAVRLTAPDANIRAQASVQSAVQARLACGAAPVQLDAAAKGDSSGLRWYHVVTGGWIREDQAKTYTDSAEAAKAAQAAKCTAPTQPSGGQGGAGAFEPTVAQVWNFVQGQDNMTGTCNGGPILPPYGLVKITPHGATLEWRSQEPAPYTFARARPNVFSYAGPTVTGEGKVTMVLTFTGKQTLTMSRALVLTSDPNCTHTHLYTGAWQWDAP
jgi:hypothetical protein